MLVPRFEYLSARSLDEALSMCAAAPGSRFLAGGTDLLPQLRVRRQVPRLVDVKKVPELHGVRLLADGAVSIGAAVALADISAHPAVRAGYPLLAACIDEVGAYPLRFRATLAGNICNASPAADTAVALIAIEALIETIGVEGARVIPAVDFFRGPGKTALLPGELCTRVVLPAAAAGLLGSYLRLSRRRGMDLATVGVLVGRRGASHRVALCAVAPTPLRVREAEALLDREGAGAARRAAELVRAAASPITDVRGSAEYRREMVGVLCGRAVKALG
jgi:CO/xanthine dehydrogenase FAD-binding subunit